MSDEVIPEEIKQFLLKNIDCVAQWEGLLMLWSDPSKEWNAKTLAQKVYTSEPEMNRLLAQLVSRDILVATPTPVLYRFQPKTQDLKRIISQAAGLYRQYLIPITHIIHSKSKSRIQEFADAFKIRKD